MAIEFMEFTHEDKSRFEPFFQAPSIDKMHADLSPTDFERFLGYMFFSAGFNVENVSLRRMPRGPGVDLNVYQPANPRKVFARIEARRYDPEGSGITLEDVLRGPHNPAKVTGNGELNEQELQDLMAYVKAL